MGKWPSTWIPHQIHCSNLSGNILPRVACKSRSCRANVRNKIILVTIISDNFRHPFCFGKSFWVTLIIKHCCSCLESKDDWLKEVCTFTCFWGQSDLSSNSAGSQSCLDHPPSSRLKIPISVVEPTPLMIPTIKHFRLLIQIPYANQPLWLISPVEMMLLMALKMVDIKFLPMIYRTIRSPGGTLLSPPTTFDKTRLRFNARSQREASGQHRLKLWKLRCADVFFEESMFGYDITNQILYA